MSLDDFGTGYSSLSYLHKFPINTLKIDRSFISRMDTDSESREITRAIVSLAHHLHMDSVAEGVESGEALALLAEMGTDVGQGYFISKPLPIGAFDDWFHTWQAAAEGPRLAVVAGGY